MDIQKIRNDFPIFNARKKHGEHFVYLDSAATSQKPQTVIDAITNFYSDTYATVHRSLYPHGEVATKMYEHIRDKTAQFINAPYREELVFTKGTTEGINFIAQAWAMHNLKPGDEILVTMLEHHANLLPWQRVAQQTGATLKFIQINTKTHLLEPDENLITNRTKLVAVTQMSNVLGSVWATGALEHFTQIARQKGARILIDAAQSIAHHKVDVQALNADFLAFASHKALGPTGAGFLYINKDLHSNVEPYQLGGSMVSSVSCQLASWSPAPLKFEAGTPPIASVMGWGAAMDYWNNNIDTSKLHTHEAMLCRRLIDQLLPIDNIKIIGDIERMRQDGHVVCILVKDIPAFDVAVKLGSQAIAVRAGNHCAQPLIEALGCDSVLRISMGVYNTTDDIDCFVEALKKIVA